MTENDIDVISSDDGNMTNPEDGLRRQVMSYSPSMMLVRHRMKQRLGGDSPQSPARTDGVHRQRPFGLSAPRWPV